MSPVDALEVALRARLVAFAPLTALVPPELIGDRHGLPHELPCIIIGDGQEVPAGISFERRHVHAFTNLHIWDRMPNLGTVKELAELVRDALRGVELQPEGYRLLDLSWSGARYLRDPSGKAHAVVTLEALLEEPRS
ncbi:DUF3168 domain-containing protein [Methylobacterium ajmalii]|uniref:DUF3168 domain-containing protein n=1 Tax=Methylobacterium ajmalii TaxID=2738439 RepID=A0ABV0A9C9_9HYPH